MIEYKGNIQTSIKIKGTCNLIKNKIKWFNFYRKAFQNFFSVLSNDLKGNYPIITTLHDGTTLTLNSKDEVALFALLSNYKNIDYDFKNDIAIITLRSLQFDHKKIKLYGMIQNLDAILAFDNHGTYDSLPIKEKTVVDIGACTGDTPILFVLNGAKRVVAIEPFPKNFEILKKNIEINGYSDKIKIILAGCGYNQNSITIDPNYNSNMRSVLQEFKNGFKIPIISLEEIINENKIDDGILKMDCEGCEYDAILNSSSEILRKFSHIQIEYHAGFKNLKEKLQKCGFKILNPIIDTPERGHIVAVRM